MLRALPTCVLAMTCDFAFRTAPAACACVTDDLLGEVS